MAVGRINASNPIRTLLPSKMPESSLYRPKNAVNSVRRWLNTTNDLWLYSLARILSVPPVMQRVTCGSSIFAESTRQLKKTKQYSNNIALTSS